MKSLGMEDRARIGIFLLKVISGRIWSLSGQDTQHPSLRLILDSANNQMIDWINHNLKLRQNYESQL